MTTAPETHKFDAQVDKVFHLMIHSLYEKKEIFLRELISNASDACDRLRYLGLTKPDLLQEGSDFRITMSFDKERKLLTIHDNGVGMTRAEMIKNLGTIARSGTQGFAEKLTGDEKKDTQLIGQFGVGFYSAFMVAEKVEVISRAAGGKKAHKWSSRADHEFTIEEISEETGRGTEITLFLRDDAVEFLDRFRIQHVVEIYSNHVAFPIILKDDEGNEDQINSGQALWQRNKSEINDEEYLEFYKGLSHLGNDKPWLTMHNKAEGTVEYTNLLFVPTAKPFDLFHPERQTQVKLYIKRVFIAEEGVEVIPSYLRFLRGVVDSADLPLNISRETVQNSVVMHRIKTSITKRVLKELAKKAKEDAAEYRKFWDIFGPVIKEGLCDGMEPRDDILEACRFQTSVSGEQLVSLEEYVDRMPEEQKVIYYITGDNVDKALASPQIEGFRKNGIEVLLLTDSVDEFWVNVVPAFKDFELKSVTRSSAELEGSSANKASSDDEEAGDDSAGVKIGSHDASALLGQVKEVLGDLAADVRVTTRLADSPVCLAVPDGAMDIRMERFMYENKQLPKVNAKIFEINPEHPIVVQLADDIAANEDQERISNTIHLLFAQANIVEGEPLPDVPGFTRRLNQLLQNSLAA